MALVRITNMKFATNSKKIIAAALAAPMLLGLASCGQDAQASTTQTLHTDGVVIITNSRANVPMPQFSVGNKELIRAALDQGLPIDIVAVDGTPEMVALPEIKVEGNNRHSRQNSLNQALQLISVGITALPDANEANAYEAFATARNAAASRGLVKPTIICLACGIETAGALSMTAEGALRAAPGDEQ